MSAVLVFIRFILAHDKTNAAFQFLSCEAFLMSSSMCVCLYNVSLVSGSARPF